ncbi:MAG: hypothetical protein J07HX64_02607 [halophilic archaeon J07HX64]|jgi:hypothetical protein|nr:MAG: hypothetical protein J07HX64_02607 [halophilic archaeon J07HX64]
MSDESSPFRSLFDTQRELIENGQAFVEQTMRVPVEMNNAVRESLTRQRELQRESIEMTRDTLSGVIDTAESTGPNRDLEEVQEAVNDGFETLLETHKTVFEGVDESYAEAADELAAATEELIDQIERLVELNEELEGQTVDAVEGVTGDGGGLGEFLAEQFGTLDADLGESGGDEQAAVERQVEQIDTVRERIERLQDELQETVEETDETNGNVGDVPGESADDETVDDTTGAGDSEETGAGDGGTGDGG